MRKEKKIMIKSNLTLTQIPVKNHLIKIFIFCYLFTGCTSSIYYEIELTDRDKELLSQYDDISYVIIDSNFLEESITFCFQRENTKCGGNIFLEKTARFLNVNGKKIPVIFFEDFILRNQKGIRNLYSCTGCSLKLKKMMN